MYFNKQHTIAEPITYTGIALHTGQDVTMTCLPAEEDTGICFRRVDLPNKPMIKARADNIVSTQRCTSIGCREEKWSIHTIEHLMAAISMKGIDNLIIELDGEEPPVTDGSAKVFMSLFEDIDLIEQKKEGNIIKVKEPIYVKDDEATLVVLPYDGFRVTYTLSYQHPVIGTQFVDYEIDFNFFKKEVAPARTFGFAEEVERLHQMGLALGGSLDNAVLIDENDTVNSLRFEDEFVRHKVLDLIGDMAVNGRVKGHFVGVKSGHALNAELSNKIMLQQEAE